MKKLITFLFISLTVLSFNIYAENITFTISGKLYFIHQKTIYIFLVDEETSKKPLIGIDTLVITPTQEDISRGYVHYIFCNVKKGKYAIRYFQDLNENGKLDTGLCGPIEPWGLSWNKYKSTIWPSFINFCFDVTKDINNMDLMLKK